MGAIMAEPGSFGSEANNNFHCWPLLFVFARVVNNKGLFFFNNVSAFGDSLFVCLPPTAGLRGLLPGQPTTTITTESLMHYDYSPSLIARSVQLLG
jgi:hypothetical protein